MPIVMTREISLPAITPMKPVKYEVYVAEEVGRDQDGRYEEEVDIWEWAADCDTLDEAAELADQLGKRYYVSITSYPVG